ncbi:hypothetical protein DV515_00003771, partial [Chloebia gouldiae]
MRRRRKRACWATTKSACPSSYTSLKDDFSVRNNKQNSWSAIGIQGMPYGNCLLLSDGPINNSTGIPFFYVTPKDNTVTDLLKNPMASLTLPEADGNFC